MSTKRTVRTTRKRTYAEHDIRKAAAAAGCDPRSVRKLLDGESVRGVAGERAAEAVKRLQAGSEAT